jgi:hypothetical protein
VYGLARYHHVVDVETGFRAETRRSNDAASAGDANGFYRLPQNFGSFGRFE